MDESVYKFYQKENNPEYYKIYDEQHSPRLDFTVERFKLNEIKNQRVGDFGCGAGFLLRRLDDSNEKYGFDGVNVREKKMCKFKWFQMDLDKKQCYQLRFIRKLRFDVSFCFETLEHIGNPYYLLQFIKEITQPNAPIYLSIPDERMLHNVIYPSLMFPHTNFEEFLSQMALPIEESVLFNGDWPSRIWKCRNASWNKKKLKFPKSESKFINCTPLEATNL